MDVREFVRTLEPVSSFQVEQRQEHSHQRDGQEKEKNRSPVNVIDDESAYARTHEHSRVKSGRHKSLSLAGRLFGHRIHRQRSCLRLCPGRANPLQKPKPDQLENVSGETAKTSSDSGNDKPKAEDLLPTVYVPNAAEYQRQTYRGDLKRDHGP